MKIIRVLLLVCIVAGIASGWKTDRTPVPNQTGLNLELKKEVLNQTYCASDNLRLTLRFTFRNTGSETLILYRYGIVIARHLVSKDLKSLKKRKYVYNPHLYLSVRRSPEIEPTPREELFVILKPGESFETDQEAHLLLIDDPTSDRKLKPGGRYFMQLQVATWFADPARARELADRWRGIGTLWYGDMLSLPMELSIKPYDKGDSCD